MAAHFIVVACLIAEPHTCTEIQVPEVQAEDVVSCNYKSRENAEKWQNDHKDQYLVIATKCVKAEDDTAKSGEAGGTPDTAKPEPAAPAAPQQPETPQQ